LLKTDKTYVH